MNLLTSVDCLQRWATRVGSKATICIHQQREGCTVGRERGKEIRRNGE